MKTLLLLLVCMNTVLFSMREEIETSKKSIPSLFDLCLNVLLKQDPKTAGHKYHGHSDILSDALLKRFGYCRPDWSIEKLLTHAQIAEALGVTSELERAATFLADHFDFRSDNGFGSVEAKVALFNTLDYSSPRVRDAISAKRTSAPLKRIGAP